MCSTPTNSVVRCKRTPASFLSHISLSNGKVSWCRVVLYSALIDRHAVFLRAHPYVTTHNSIILDYVNESKVQQRDWVFPTRHFLSQEGNSTSLNYICIWDILYSWCVGCRWKTTVSPLPLHSTVLRKTKSHHANCFLTVITAVKLGGNVLDCYWIQPVG